MKESSPSQFVAHAEQVLRRIEMYMGSSDPALSKKQVEYMASRIRQMKEAATDARLPPKEERYKNLTHMIVDSWPIGHSLGQAITALEDEYTRL